MQRPNAYAALAAELVLWGGMDRGELVARVGAGPIVRKVELAGEVVSIEVSVSWVDERHESLTVEATANGPSHWHTERLVERVTVPAAVAGGL
jgi:hypothetical protein